MDEFVFPLSDLEFNDAERSIVINFASSQERDRIGDFLDVTGIDTTNHQKNPVAYLDHGKLNQPLPIGKCESPDGTYTVWIDEEKGLATAKIYLACDVKDFPAPTPELVYQLYKGGYVVGGSIGYRPLDVEVMPPKPNEGFFNKSNWLKRVELQEVSIVGLPMSPSSVKSCLAAGVINGKPINQEVKSLLGECLNKSWSTGVDINMHKDSASPAMSASDQSRGGSFVPPGGSVDQTLKELLEKFKAIIAEHEKPLRQGSSEETISHNIEVERHAGKPEEQAIAIAEHEAHKGKKMNTKSEDKPDVAVEPVEDAKSVMKACKEHLEDCSLHKDTPDDLREEHADWAKALGDALEDEKSESDMEEEGSAKSCKSEEEDEEEKSKSTKAADDAPHEDQDDLELIKGVKEHLDEAAEHEGMPKMMSAAHKHYADELEKCMKSEDEEGEPELSEHEEKKLKHALLRIQTKLAACERKMFRALGR